MYFFEIHSVHHPVINILEYENVVVINILEKYHYFTTQTVHAIIKKTAPSMFFHIS